MRGFRFLWNNVTGETHDPDDEADENVFEAKESAPSVDFVTRMLLDQGVTFNQLVQTICYNEHKEYEDDAYCERVADELFGKIRMIVSNNYTHEQAPYLFSRLAIVYN